MKNLFMIAVIAVAMYALVASFATTVSVNANDTEYGYGSVEAIAQNLGGSEVVLPTSLPETGAN